MMSVDIETGLAIRIDGELGKYHTLPINSLIEIGKNLQELIHSIVTANDSNVAIDIDNFNIELSDFKPGSVIPEFKLTQRVVPTISGVYGQRKDVVDKLNKILHISHTRDYNSVISIFPNSENRNKVINSLFKFSNSFHNSPVQFGNLQDGKFKKTFDLHKLSKETKDKLLTSIPSSSDSINITEKGFAVIEIMTSGKRTTNKIKSVVKKENHSLAYSPNFLIVNNKKYLFNFPLHCSFEIEKGNVTIKNEMLDIYAIGENEDKAKQDFGEEFDYLYVRLNSLSEEQLGKSLANVKKSINSVVRFVDKW